MKTIPPFDPHPLVGGKHLQTVYSVLFPPKNTLRMEYLLEDKLLSLPDGDRLWLEHNPPLAKNPPVTGAVPFNGCYLVLIHGMEGSSDSHYMISVGREALHRGFGVIRMNHRNCGKGFGYAKKPYNAGISSDVLEVLKYVYKSFTKKIFVVGFSLSANLLLKFFGEERKNQFASGFAAISPPLDLNKNCEFIDSIKGRIYREHFLITLKEKLKSGIYDIPPHQVRRGLKAKTFFDFDDFITAPASGYTGVMEYYRKCSCINYLHKIKTPGVVIHAEDDPVVPSDVWKSVDWSSFKTITSVLTKKGGHVGFVSKKEKSSRPDRHWLSRTLIDYFETIIPKKKRRTRNETTST